MMRPSEGSELSHEQQELLGLLLEQEGLHVSAIPVPRVEDDGPAPLSYAQERFWILDRLAEGSAAYNVAVGLRLRGSLDPRRLEDAVTALVERHESLRTTFPTEDGVPVQRIHPPTRAQIDCHSLETLDSAQRESEASRLASLEARRAMDVAAGPLFRVHLYRLGESDHVFLLVVHHLIVDGWSLTQLLRELASLYATRGHAGTQTGEGIRYRDFARWQRQWLTDRALEADLAWWEQALDGVSASLDLANARPRPARPSYRGDVRRFSLGSERSSALRALARTEGATPFMAFLAALQTLLYRYSGQEDVVVGTAVSERYRPETEPILGCFANNLALRVGFAGAPSYREIVRRAKAAFLGALAHQSLPFERLLERRSVRDLSRSPIFQVFFVLHSERYEDSFRVAGLDVREWPVQVLTTRFDLSVDVFDGPDGTFTGVLEYSQDLFDESDADQMLDSLLAILDEALAAPDRPVEELSLVTPETRSRVLERWAAGPEVPVPAARLPEWLAASRHGPATRAAVSAADLSLSYEELEARSSQLAHLLVQRGVRRGSLVALLTDRSPDLVVALLGILKAGAGYVPLDPSYPRERLEYMLEDSGARWLVTQQPRLAGGLAGSFQPVLLDVERRALDTLPKTFQIPPLAEDDPAYVIYTSGSTGRPKGVSIPHGAVINLLASMLQLLDFTAADTLLAVTTISFDIAGLELFLPLACGARCVLADRDEASDGRALRRLLERSGATLMQATPSTWRLLLDAGWNAGGRLKVLCGGEPLPRELADELLATGAELWNVYGPTETTIWSTAHRVQAGKGPVPIGRPLANTRVYVRDARGEPCPPGLPGELFIGGAGVATGYWQRPDLTKDRFIADPLAVHPAARVYRTGDRARFLADGTLECLGRTDHQIKVRGHRVEPGEIEALLDQHPGIGRSVVAARGEGERRTLVAWFESAGSTPPPAAELRAHLAVRLPDYMIPTAFVALGALPLTPNGKIDRSALPDSVHSGAETILAAVPHDKVERRLVALWEDVLGVRPIGIRDGFFDLGGHSLLAARLFVRIEKAFGRALPLATIFRAPTVEMLAEVLRTEEPPGAWSPLVPIQPAGTRPPFYCVHPVGGNALTYVDLARHLGDDQPLYGLQARGLDGKRRPHVTLEEMARDYVTGIRAFQPHGPYYLGGASFGGLVAFEMAQQLVAQGESVGLLALFDTFGPNYPQYVAGFSPTRRRVRRLVERFDLHWANLRTATGLRERLNYVAAMVIRIKSNAATRLFRLQKVALEHVVDPLPRVLRRVKRSNVELADRYVPRPYPGRITVFRASAQPSGVIPDPSLGWSRYAVGGVDAHTLPGRHRTLFYEPHTPGSPNVSNLAQELSRCLDAAYQQAAVPSKGL